MYCLGILKSVNFKLNIFGRKYPQYLVLRFTYLLHGAEADREEERKFVLNVLYVCVFTENFLSGYRIVFDRERMVLGWKRSNCK